MPKPAAILILATITAFLAACASSNEPRPATIDTGPNALKRSPCACFELPQDIPPGAKTG